MPKPLTPAVWASGKSFGFQPSALQQAQGFDYIASIRPGTGAPITDDHDWPLNIITAATKWMMDQIPDAGLKSAAFRDVGTAAGQVPDMSAFPRGSGWNKLPDGTIIQTGTSLAGALGYPNAISLPIPFKVSFTIATSFDTTAGAADCPSFATSPIGLTGFYLSSSRSSAGAGARWIAIGV